MHCQATKFVQLIPPAAIKNNASYTPVALDTQGYEYLQVVVSLGATDIALTALKLQECATSGGSYADITGMVFGTSNNADGSASVLPSATDDNKIFVFELDLRGRQRYIELVCTVGNGSTGGFVSAEAILSRPKIDPQTATERGLGAQVLRA